MTAETFVWLLAGFVAIPAAYRVFRALVLEVADGDAAVITRFGKLHEVVRQPGLRAYPWRALPWYEVTTVSLRRDYRDIREVHVNDARGTTVIVDLWVEFHIEDPARALFAVTDWDRALQTLLAHAATSILGNRQFQEILCDRMETSELLRHEVEQDVARWGLHIDSVFLRKVSVLPEVSQQMLRAVAARLERAKADVEESGRLAVARLEAETRVRVAALEAEAKAQYPLALSRAYARLQKSPDVLQAYDALHRLSLLRPHRTTVFRGFPAESVRAVDALMTDGHGTGTNAPPETP